MKIRKGMDEKYQSWLGLRRKEPQGRLMTDGLQKVADCLDAGLSSESALKIILNLTWVGLFVENRVQLALALSFFHERGAEFRFAWNKYYKGEDWALDMEISEKRLHNPS